ncbi:MAG: hypothetical protein E6J34_22600 [Chloroflexi bacterium]|nr:MAG: hypothetical protein E6J34_22600 [Chloroflexota bacterium]
MKATPITLSQQTIAPSGQTREAEPNERVQEVVRFTYPAWPTSKPGPQATSPLPGQHPHPLRTDQILYECYDQERGRPCVSPPSLFVCLLNG